MVMNEERLQLYIVAIVGVVAAVGILVLLLGLDTFGENSISGQATSAIKIVRTGMEAESTDELKPPKTSMEAESTDELKPQKGK